MPSLAMDKANHTLKLLAELPDPVQELFPQLESLDTFHLFPKLPIEVRYKIW